VLLLDCFRMEITLNGIFVNLERPGWRVKESWFTIFFPTSNTLNLSPKPNVQVQTLFPIMQQK
jgi:hypothetical protein